MPNISSPQVSRIERLLEHTNLELMGVKAESAATRERMDALIDRVDDHTERLKPIDQGNGESLKSRVLFMDKVIKGAGVVGSGLIIAVAAQFIRDFNRPSPEQTHKQIVQEVERDMRRIIAEELARQPLKTVLPKTENRNGPIREAGDAGDRR